MNDEVDEWLAKARAITSQQTGVPDVAGVRGRLDATGLSSVLALRRRDVHLLVLCVFFSAAATLWASTHFELGARQSKSTTWIATPSAVSPFGLLIGR